MKLPDHLSSTLVRCANELTRASDNWWVFGSAAMALHGIDAGLVADVDILISVRDAEDLSQAWSCHNLADGGTDQFRSRTLLKPDFGPVPVEIMAGFEYRTSTGWNVLSPRTRQEFWIGTAVLYAPELSELIEIFREFGRPKDLHRAQIMAAAS